MCRYLRHAPHTLGDEGLRVRHEALCVAESANSKFNCNDIKLMLYEGRIHTVFIKLNEIIQTFPNRKCNFTTASNQNHKS